MCGGNSDGGGSSSSSNGGGALGCGRGGACFGEVFTLKMGVWGRVRVSLGLEVVKKMKRLVFCCTVQWGGDLKIGTCMQWWTQGVANRGWSSLTFKKL